MKVDGEDSDQQLHWTIRRDQKGGGELQEHSRKEGDTTSRKWI